MVDSPDRDREMPPPLPGAEAAARRAEPPMPLESGTEPSQARQVGKAVFIGLVGFIVSAAIPIIVVIILAIVAQLMISGH